MNRDQRLHRWGAHAPVCGARVFPPSPFPPRLTPWPSARPSTPIAAPNSSSGAAACSVARRDVARAACCRGAARRCSSRDRRRDTDSQSRLPSFPPSRRPTFCGSARGSRAVRPSCRCAPAGPPLLRVPRDRTALADGIAIRLPARDTCRGRKARERPDTKTRASPHPATQNPGRLQSRWPACRSRHGTAAGSQLSRSQSCTLASCPRFPFFAPSFPATISQAAVRCGSSRFLSTSQLCTPAAILAACASKGRGGVLKMIKRLPIFLLLLLAVPVGAQDKKPTTLREVLLAELKSTHTSEEWFVPVNIAVKGLTAEQASWTDGKGNHSVGQLAYHIVYWNRRNLERLKGEPSTKFSGNNDETFDKFDAKTWNQTVQDLDDVMNELEKWVETADDAKLAQNAQVFTHISTHNAYHIGQIIYVRKEQGSWDPKNGVK